MESGMQASDSAVCEMRDQPCAAGVVDKDVDKERADSCPVPGLKLASIPEGALSFDIIEAPACALQEAAANAEVSEDRVLVLLQ